jgi:hypothetical protein
MILFCHFFDHNESLIFVNMPFCFIYKEFSINQKQKKMNEHLKKKCFIARFWLFFYVLIQLSG